MPTILTPDLEDRFAELLEQGNYPQTVCDALGVRYSTYLQWIKRGEGRIRDRPGTPETIAFANRVRSCTAVAETKVVKMVLEGIPKDPALGLKFLSRRYKDRWSETIKHEVSWVVKAIHMLRVGEVTLEALEAELPADDFEMVKTKYLENPAEDGEWVDAPASVKEEINAE